MDPVIIIPFAFALGIFSVLLIDVHFWFKWILSYIYIEVNKRTKSKRFIVYDPKALNDAEKVGFIAPEEEFRLESPCSESHLEKAEDEIFCYGVNSKSECLIVSISRHTDQKADASIYLKLASGKTYTLQLTDHFQQSCSDKNVFSCGDLQMSYTSPMRRWRIFYNGYLREMSDDDSENGRMVVVKFALRWRAASEIFDATRDINSKSLARAFAKVDWRSTFPPLDKLSDALNFYVQSGIIHGTVTVPEEQDEQEIYLFGQRIRNLGDTSCIENGEVEYVLGCIHQNGAYVYLSKTSLTNIVKDLCFGFIVQPDCVLKVMKKTEIIIKGSKYEKSLEANFKNGIFHSLHGSFCSPSLLTSNRKDGGRTSFKRFDFYINGKKGSGIRVKRHIIGLSKQNISTNGLQKSPLSVSPLVVPFTDEICQESEITGGKGSSLGKLTFLSKDLQTFIVPNGIVVTTAAYKNFVTKEILQKIKVLENIVYGNTGDVKEACKSLCEDIERTEFPKELREAVVVCLKKTFGENLDLLKFAVRSSATGEDTEQMSAAGQMDTFLGVSGLDEILHAIKKCWASQFGYIAIQYKRRYGQCLNSPMAVVIQEMVACDVAGVLFTCDPLTGNPAVMTITANYGLGESVVSGSEEPDTIELQRDPEDHLHMKDIIIGAKSRKIIVKDGEGTALENVSENEKTRCCLSQELIMRLGYLGIEVERYYRSHRDIEWGVQNNNIYLFQSRPVTSGSNETSFEIEHEFDNPLRVENDFYSVCNVGEVIPGALTPLGMEHFYKVLTLAFYNEDTAWLPPVRCQYFYSGMMVAYNHGMFGVTDMFRGQEPENLDYFSQASMIAFFGRIIRDEEIFQVCNEKYGDSAAPSSLFGLLRVLLLSDRKLRKEKKICEGYHIAFEKFKTSQELFDHLLKNCTDLTSVTASHLITSQASSVWNMLIFTILGKAKGGFDDEVYNNASCLLSTGSDVESADVPSAIQSLAFHISKAVNIEEFKGMSTEEALSWLQETNSSAGVKFREFLKKHGHRCIKEFDLYSIPWGSDPKPLVKLLQNLAGNVTEDSIKKKSENLNETLSKLTVPLGYFSRCLLKCLLPISHRAIQNRETSKSLMVKGFDEWRKAFRHLAKLMVSEGRIPEEDLLFFMRLDEIKELLNTRSPKIIARSIQRQKRYPVMNKYIFAEIMKGVPKPINLEETPIVPTAEDFMMKGIPVSQGVAEGFIHVAITLEEASQLKPGEILLTYGTDIGWTPYFPTLAGVVTELGGLISHGAVVSREYGIPCIAGMHGATRKFQTGDYVRLDGNTGILQKLPPPKST